MANWKTPAKFVVAGVLIAAVSALIGGIVRLDYFKSGNLPHLVAYILLPMGIPITSGVAIYLTFRLWKNVKHGVLIAAGYSLISFVGFVAAWISVSDPILRSIR